MNFFKISLKWSEKLVFERFGGFCDGFFFQLGQFDFRLQSFLSFGAFKKVHLCSNCAYLPLLEFIKGQLKLYDVATICRHKILVNFRF